VMAITVGEKFTVKPGPILRALSVGAGRNRTQIWTRIFCVLRRALVDRAYACAASAFLGLSFHPPGCMLSLALVSQPIALAADLHNAATQWPSVRSPSRTWRKIQGCQEEAASPRDARRLFRSGKLPNCS